MLAYCYAAVQAAVAVLDCPSDQLAAAYSCCVLGLYVSVYCADDLCLCMC